MRELDTKTLDGAAKYYAGLFLADNGRRDREWVMRQFYNFRYKDTFIYLRDQFQQILGPQSWADFKSLALTHHPERTDEVLEQSLAHYLAVDPDGNHAKGRIGKVQVGQRYMGQHLVDVEPNWSVRRRKVLGLPKTSPERYVVQKMANLYWPIYAGETEERLAGNVGEGGADPLPDGTPGLPIGALNTRISNECAILACDAIVDNLDEGTGAAVLSGRSGSQPADPDTTATGTLLFKNVCSDPAFGNASDAAPGGQATASTVSDDTSADATGTLGYVRASATNDGSTPLDDHIDGEAGTSGADFNYNTLSIVAGSTVSLTSWTATMPES